MAVSTTHPPRRFAHSPDEIVMPTFTATAGLKNCQPQYVANVWAVVDLLRTGTPMEEWRERYSRPVIEDAKGIEAEG